MLTGLALWKKFKDSGFSKDAEPNIDFGISVELSEIKSWYVFYICFLSVSSELSIFALRLANFPFWVN